MKLKMPIPNTLFRMGLLLMILKVFLSFSNIIEVAESVDTVLSIMAAGMLVGSVLEKSQSLKRLIIYTVIVLLALITSVRTGNLMIFIAVITCIAVRGEKLDEAIRFMLFWEGILIVFQMILSVAMHLVGFSMLTRVSGLMRYNFGFSHPNVFACVLVNLFAMFHWLHYDTIRMRHRVAILLIEGIAFLITDSRTGLIVTFFLVIITYLYRFSDRVYKSLIFMASFVVPMLTIFIYWMCKAYISGNSLVFFVDNLLSGRMLLGAYSLDRFGVSFFGQNLSNVTIKWDSFWKISGITFDNIYTYMLVTEFIWLIVIIVAFYKLARKGNTKCCVFILAWALYGITEIHVINPILFFPILLVTCLFEKGEEVDLCEAKIEP